MDLTYKRTIKLIQASALAEKNAKTMLAPGTVLHVPQKTTASASRRPSSRRMSFNPSQGQPRDCYHCGGKHNPYECKFKEATCHFCKKPGHIARACRSKAKQTSPPEKRSAHRVGRENSIESDELKDLYQVEGKSRPSYVVELFINGAPLEMEIDTGAAMTLISEKTYRNLWKQPPKLKPTSIRLRTYTGQQLVVLGTLNALVKYEAQSTDVPLVVVKGSGPSLLGRNWLEHICLNWKKLQVNYTAKYRMLEEILEKHKVLFRSELGQAKTIEAKLHIASEAKPRFCKARQVPHSLREKVDDEVSRLELSIEPVQFSEWAAPIVPVLKPDGSVKICGDYKLTVNQAAKLDPYPLPRIEGLFAQLAGGKRFTKLDIAHVYQQIPLSEESRNSVTINTQKGLFRYNRLPFGVHSAPAIFQRAMEGLLRDIPSAIAYIDDILVTGKTEEEHLNNLDKVLTHLEEDLTLKKKNVSLFSRKLSTWVTQYHQKVYNRQRPRSGPSESRLYRKTFHSFDNS